MEVFKDGRVNLVFNFYSLSRAIQFTEDIINQCTETSDIVDRYISEFQNDKPLLTIKNGKTKSKMFD